MRKLIYLLLLPILGLLGGCQKGAIEMDHAPVVTYISVLDANGIDLLNPNNPETLDITKIKALYKGEQLDCAKDPYSYVATRYYMPNFYGLQVANGGNWGVYVLQFGEFGGDPQTVLDESVTLLWPDGSSDKIDFKDSASGKLEWFLNGAKLENFKWPIKIVK